MNIADGRQLKTGSALFNAYQMFSSKSAQEVVTQKKKNHVVFTDYQLPHVLAMLTSNIYADYDFSLFRKSTWGGNQKYLPPAPRTRDTASSLDASMLRKVGVLPSKSLIVRTFCPLSLRSPSHNYKYTHWCCTISYTPSSVQPYDGMNVTATRLKPH